MSYQLTPKEQAREWVKESVRRKGDALLVTTGTEALLDAAFELSRLDDATIAVSYDGNLHVRGGKRWYVILLRS